MGSLHGLLPTTAKQLAAELKHPNVNAIWDRALEVFGDETKARSWMKTARDLFSGRLPENLVKSGDPAEQRLVLEILIRIDYGVFS